MIKIIYFKYIHKVKYNNKSKYSSNNNNNNNNFYKISLISNNKKKWKNSIKLHLLNNYKVLTIMRIFYKIK
jgi:hypothetical protein